MEMRERAGLVAGALLLFFVVASAQQREKGKRGSRTLTPVRASFPSSSSSSFSPPPRLLRVCFAVRSGQDWRSTVQRFLSAAVSQADVRFGVLVECERVEDVDDDEGKDLRAAVEVKHTVPPSRPTPAKRVRRLTKKFVSGMETLVLVVDPRAEPTYGWDAALARVPLPEGGVLTAPFCEHEACFPTLRPGPSGPERGGAKPFRFAEEGVAVPSVCGCYELLAARPSAFLEGAGSYWVAAFPLLRPRREQLGEGVGEVELTPASRMGLSPRATHGETRLKYGSTAAAKVATKLDRKEGRGR